jgi:hypothetical protein
MCAADGYSELFNAFCGNYELPPFADFRHIHVTLDVGKKPENVPICCF